MTEGASEVVGHKTFNTGEIGPDGFPVLHHEPLSREEADAIHKRVEEATLKRATDMPTEEDAVRALWDAQQRLKELGWQDPTYAHALKQDGIEIRLIELGSSGLHIGTYHVTNGHDVWWIGPDGSPARPCLVKPLEDCGNCHKCLKGKVTPGGLPVTATRMILCRTCGNKRCPKASDHELACTDSNTPGQPGSVY